uniref:Uncharacterized protein n=1 Tax=mine drainage metagenome TaxID=410659 RepID=E6QRS1_9ZZZZ
MQGVRTLIFGKRLPIFEPHP